MDTRHLASVEAVARHRSFTLAAQELFMAQSTISRQVAAVERELGVALFERGGRQVCLTRAGRAFLPLAKKVLEAAERAAAASAAARTTLPEPRTAPAERAP